MGSLGTSSKYPTLHDVRTILIVNSVVGVIFNIVIAVIGRKKTEGALGIVFLALSGIVSIFQIWKPPSKPILNVLLDAFFTIALGVLYVLVLVLSSVLRRQIAGVYANMFCLVACVLHGYAFLRVVHHLFKTRSRSGAKFCPHCSSRPADYKSVPTTQEPRGDRDDDPFADDDHERTPLYRDSEDTAVMEV